MPKRVWIGLAAVSLLSCQVPFDQESYQEAHLVVPFGSPEQGRETFVNLGCASCHRVAWEPGFAPPVADVAAPELGDFLARRTAGNVATSIIVPSHRIPRDVREATEGELSPMGDFKEAMTVQELIDVVAYLRTRGGQRMAQLPRYPAPTRTPPL